VVLLAHGSDVCLLHGLYEISVAEWLPAGLGPAQQMVERRPARAASSQQVSAPTCWQLVEVQSIAFTLG